MSDNEIRGIAGNEDDKDPTGKWREVHHDSFEGFEVDPALPTNGFRTADNMLLLSPDLYSRTIGRLRPTPMTPPQ